MGPAVGSWQKPQSLMTQAWAWRAAPWCTAVGMAGFVRQAPGFAAGWMWIISHRATKDDAKKTG